MEIRYLPGKSEHKLFMRIEFHLPDGTANLFVALLDNAGVDAWAHKFAGGFSTLGLLHDHLYVHPVDSDLVEQHYIAIDTSLAVLKKAGLRYAGPMLEPFDQARNDQLHVSLNHLHRFFTENQKACNQRWFGSDFDYTAVSRWLDQINQAVHGLELFVPRAPADLAVYRLEEIKLWQSDATNVEWLTFDDHGQYHSSEFYDVVLSSEILGKTLLQSYLDNDNPNHWDTSGHICSAGGLQICLRPDRQRVYSSHSFKNWCLSHGLDPVSANYDFPIGNIINKDSMDFARVLDCLQHPLTKQVPVCYHQQ